MFGWYQRKGSDRLWRVALNTEIKVWTYWKNTNEV
jgi:hypothetical protein